MPITEIPLNPDQQESIDLLDRQAFVDQLSAIAKGLAKNRKSACYAINGSWGSGKSFVLDMFEAQAKIEGQEGTVLDQYVIFRYNCWDYDYYEEPLIAIVASILEQYESKVCLMDEKKKAVLKETLLKIGKGLFKVGRQALKDATGIDIQSAADLIVEITEGSDERIDAIHSYDSLFDFKLILRKLQATIGKLAEEQALIIIVDELDRCLPEYTIRVLERLHHLFDNIPNVQVVLSIDKSQLEHTVKQIYGVRTNVNKYLEKFIDFEIKLTMGSFNDNVDTKFSEYFNRFEYRLSSTKSTDIYEFKAKIREGIDIRTSIAIFDKCQLLHTLLNTQEEKSDFSIMCVEVFLTLLKYYDIDVKEAKSNFDISTLFEASKTFRTTKTKQTLPGLMVIREKYRESESAGRLYFASQNSRNYVRTDDIWGLLLAVYRLVLGFNNDFWEDLEYRSTPIKTYALEYWKLLKVIC